MLTKAILVKIALTVAAILALLTVWYRDYRADALERVLEKQRLHQQPTTAQREDARRRERQELTNEGWKNAQKELFGSSGGKR